MFGIHLGLMGMAPIALYIGSIGVFFASMFWRPTAGMYLLALMIPLQTGRYRLHQFPLGSMFIDIILLGVILGLYLKNEKIEFKAPLVGFFLLFSAFYYLSLWQGAFFLNGNMPLSIADPRFSDWKNYVEMFLFGIVANSVFKDKKQIAIMLVVMAASVLLVNRTFYNLMNERDLSHFSYETRDSGALGYAGENGFAAFEAMFIVFAMGIAAFAKRLPLKLAIFALVWTCSYCLLYSYSRGGYLSALAGLLVVAVLKDRKYLMVLAVLLLGWQTLLPWSVQQRIMMTTDGSDGAENSEIDRSSARRVELWEDAFTVFQSSPLLGTGFDTYQFMGRIGTYQDTHNYYVKVAVETGIVGLGLFLWLLIRMWGLSYALFRRAEDPFWQAIGLAYLALLSAAIVGNFFGDRWTYQQVNGYMWLLFGCVMRGLAVVSEQGVQSAEAETVAMAVDSPEAVSA